MRTRWNEQLIEERLRSVIASTGVFPTVSYLKETGQHDLSNQISKKGGFIEWSKRLGVNRAHYDCDTGWDGEDSVAVLLESKGFKVGRRESVKWPFDLLVNDVLRVDVKTAKFATYGHCSGWFYRTGKAPQADVVVLHQSDTGRVYFLPWYITPFSNITITNGGEYSKFADNYNLVSKMISIREIETLSF